MVSRSTRSSLTLAPGKSNPENELRAQQKSELHITARELSAQRIQAADLSNKPNFGFDEPRGEEAQPTKTQGTQRS